MGEGQAGSRLQSFPLIRHITPPNVASIRSNTVQERTVERNKPRQKRTEGAGDATRKPATHDDRWQERHRPVRTLRHFTTPCNHSHPTPPSPQPARHFPRGARRGKKPRPAQSQAQSSFNIHPSPITPEPAGERPGLVTEGGKLEQAREKHRALQQ